MTSSTPTNEGLSARLRFKAQVAFDANKRAGRSGPEWDIDQELEWQAADALDAKDKLLAEAEKAFAGVIAMAGRKTVEFDAARDVMRKIREHLKP